VLAVVVMGAVGQAQRTEEDELGMPEEVPSRPLTAHLIVRKTVIQPEVVAFRDTYVLLQIFNPTDLPAYDVDIDDTLDWSNPDRWSSVLGTPSAHWPSIPPHSNVTHIFVVQPRFYGKWDSSRANVTYRESPDSPTKTLSGSTSLFAEDEEVLTRSETEMKSAPHLREWGIFTLLSFLSLLLPLSVWGYHDYSYSHGIGSGKPKKK